MRYFPSDVSTISVPQTGHVHRKQEGYERLVVDCQPCDPYLARYGGVETIAKVRLTHDEQLDIDEQRRKAEMVLPRLADAIVSHAADTVRGIPS